MSESEAESVGEIENDGVEFDVDILTGDGVQRSQYTLLKTWVTGDKAIMEEEDIKMEIFDLARSWMNASLLFKMPGQVEGEDDIALWKCFRSYRTQSSSHSIRLFHCPMFYLCKCNAGLRIITGPTYICLYKRGEHCATSHDMTQKAATGACRPLVFNSAASSLFSSAAALVSDTRPGDPFAALSPLENSIAERVRNGQLCMMGDENGSYGRFRSQNDAENQWACSKRVRFHMRDAFAQVHTSFTLLFALIVFIFSLTCAHCRRPGWLSPRDVDMRRDSKICNICLARCVNPLSRFGSTSGR